jgi:NAD-dependent deacetylase
MAESRKTPRPTPKPKRPSTIDRTTVDAVAAVLIRAKRVLVVTGAGMSADSGLPTYRGIGGLYHDKVTEDGLPIEVVLSGEMFARKPELTWKHIHEIELACRDAKPNRGHEILAALEEKLERVVILTQNVDGFHRAAGSTNVIEIHGDIHALRCTKCRWRDRVVDYSGLTLPPKCPQCRAIVRPDVVLFGEALPNEPFTRLEHELAAGFDAVFSIGTTAMFPYIARPVLLAKADGKPTVEINPARTDLTDVVDLRIKSTARNALKAVFMAYKALMPKSTRLGR